MNLIIDCFVKYPEYMSFASVFLMVFILLLTDIIGTNISDCFRYKYSNEITKDEETEN